MYIRKLKVNNWKCFDKTKKWKFNRNELIVAPNGTGKSSLFEAIRYAIWGKLPVGFNMNTVRNNSEEDCMISIEFTYGINDENHVVMNRQFGLKSIHEMYINGELVAESVRTIEPIVNKIVDFSISNELWTNSITESNILRGSYFTDTILEETLRDPNNIIIKYKGKIRDRNKQINQFDEHLMDFEGIKQRLEEVKGKLKDKGSSNEEYKKALSVMELSEQLNKLKDPVISKEDNSKFLKALGLYSNIELAKGSVQKLIDKENEYKIFESMKEPKVSKKQLDEFMRLVEEWSVERSRKEAVENIKRKIEQEGEYKSFEKLTKPEKTEEQSDAFLRLSSELTSSDRALTQIEVKEYIDTIEKKIEVENRYKEFEKLTEPEVSEDNFTKFSDLVKQGTDNDDKLLKLRNSLQQELIEEQDKTINRFLGISSDAINACVEVSLENHSCIFCNGEFNEDNKEEISKELVKPSRDDSKITKLKEQLAVVDIYKSLDDYKKDYKYYELRELYNIAKSKNFESPLVDKLTKDVETLKLFKDGNDALEVKAYYDAKRVYDIKSKTYESVIKDLENKLSVLNLYNSAAEVNEDLQYWKAKNLYDIKSNEDKTYLNSLLAQLNDLSIYDSLREDSLDVVVLAKEDDEFYNVSERFDVALKQLPNYKEIIESYDGDNLELWKVYEELQEEYTLAAAQQERIKHIEDLKLEVEDYKEKLNVVQTYVSDATKFYTQRIMDKAGEILQSINSRYKGIFLEGKFFNVIVERDSDHKISVVPVAQLSSGEKTMTALALLFAVHDVMVPELPFLFDEVFSALDHSNAVQIRDFLNKQTSQIFVITHDSSWIDSEGTGYSSI